MAFAAALLLRGIPLLRARVGHVRAPSWRHFSGLSTSDELPSPQSPAPPATGSAPAGAKGPDQPPLSKVWGGDEPEYRRWKDKEKEILNDIEQITTLTKDILHSGRYMDGECLSAEDEKAVVEKLLAYHPHSEDKIGCGLDSVMVDRHPQFRKSRCLFVVRTDGGWIDFSYQKCLRAYIRDKYPSHAERFIREHFKRS